MLNFYAASALATESRIMKATTRWRQCLDHLRWKLCHVLVLLRTWRFLNCSKWQSEVLPFFLVFVFSFWSPKQSDSCFNVVSGPRAKVGRVVLHSSPRFAVSWCRMVICPCQACQATSSTQEELAEQQWKIVEGGWSWRKMQVLCLWISEANEMHAAKNDPHWCCNSPSSTCLNAVYALCPRKDHHNKIDSSHIYIWN